MSEEVCEGKSQEEKGKRRRDKHFEKKCKALQKKLENSTEKRALERNEDLGTFSSNYLRLSSLDGHVITLSLPLLVSGLYFLLSTLIILSFYISCFFYKSSQVLHGMRLDKEDPNNFFKT